MKLILNPLVRRIGLPCLSSVVVWSLTLMSPSAAKAIPVIVNGSFEGPLLAAGSTDVPTTPTGWTTTTPGTFAPRMFNNPADGPFAWPDAQDDAQYVAISSSVFAGGSTSLSQSIHISVAGDYLLAWFDNAFFGVSGTPYNVSLVPSGLGLPMTSAYGAPLGASSWSPRSLLTTLAAGDYTLVFKGDPIGIGRTLLDNVSLNAVTSTSVPEAGSTAGLLCLGFAGMAVLARRRASWPKFLAV